MKAFLSLLLSLWALIGHGQTITRKAVIAPAPGKSGTPYSVIYQRDLSAYPATTSGLNSLTLAIAQGKIPLTVEATGCPVPTGVTPPTVAPTCNPGATLPTWIAGLRYSLDASTKLLSIQGAGTLATIAFHPITGDGFPTTNPDGVAINADTDYYSGTISQGLYTKQWQLFYSGTALQLLLKDGSSSGTYTAPLTPVPGASNVVIAGGTTTNPPSSTTTTPGSSTTTSPGAGTATGTPLAGAHDWQPFSSSVPSDFVSTLESSALKLDLDLREGTGASNGLAGAIRRIVDKQTGRNLINLPVYGPGNKDDVGIPFGTTDVGRGINECLYRDPAPWTYNGVTFPIGDNPNESGDESMTSSQRINFGNNGTMMYTEISPNQWAGSGTRTGERFKKWLKLESNVIKAWWESSFNRTAATGKNNPIAARFQEAPCLYGNGSDSQIWFYDGDNPYSGASPRYIELNDNIQQASGAHYMTENWIAVINGSTGRGIGIIMETPCSQIGQFDGKFGKADGSNFGANYIAWFPRMNLDWNIVWRHSNLFVSGTLAEIRQKAYEYTSWKQTMEVRFNQPGRQLWSIDHATDPGYQTSRTSWPVTFSNVPYPTIFSPAVALNGNNKHHYVKYRYISPTRSVANVMLLWVRARQSAGYTDGTQLWSQRFPDGAAVGTDYQYVKTLIADGQWHVADFDLSNKPEYKGIITEIRFQPENTADAAGETFEMEWISANPTGPTTP